MGELTDLVDRLQGDERIISVRFNSTFLEDVGNTLGSRGFDEARLFIWQHRDRADLVGQVPSLLVVLDEMEKVSGIKKDRALAKYILKNKLNLILD
ncbi:MAG: hypothetical protein JW778_06490 [Candidatus Altiarchaeota archaeon]|nr:hypothetical protein [Candidatus Altiarchaeota archaeon]